MKPATPISLHILLVGLLLLTLQACQKVVTPDLNPGERLLVIEGEVTDGPGPYTARLSRSADYYQPGDPQGIAGAFVTITDGSNKPDTLTDRGGGIYQTRSLRGLAGHTYALRATVSGKTYTASSTLPTRIPIQSLSQESQAVGKLVYVHFTDPARVPNYYRWTVFINGKQQNVVFAASDRLFDGLQTRQALFVSPNSGNEIETGDRVRIQMQCIDPAVFNYFFALSQVIGGSQSQSATPANPTTNLSGGALGYFSAYSATTDSLTVQ